MEGENNLQKGAPAAGETMQRLIHKGPKYRAGQHMVAIGAVFGFTLASMYYMRRNIDKTMPWRAAKKQ